ncbi:cobalamin biosynthesis protein [Microvirga sp. 2YAF29]|uniref:cobalamin biosynthesis protein n=1 Tax=Microvirga sp. 2YAF29 TaxID=3233031 RepID=UPI003F96C381
MIVAGVGFRRSATADEIVSLVEQAVARAVSGGDVLKRLATIGSLANLPAFAEASHRLAVTGVAVDDAAINAAAPRVSTHSVRSLAAHGIGSVAEAAALAAGGSKARLILKRIKSASVTCALAQGEANS